MRAEWLELELASELRPVAAPDALWARVQSGRRVERPVSRWRWEWAATAAAAAMMAVAGVVWMTPRPDDLAQAAARELRTATHVDLQSSDASEISSWLGREVGVPVKLAGSEHIQLQGARILRERGRTVGVVAYCVDQRPARLLVARAADGVRQHGGVTWSVSGAAQQTACLMCHATL